MCGRYTLSADKKELQKRFKIDEDIEDYSPSYNIAPSSKEPVIVRNGSNKIEYMRWGLIPFWSKKASIGNHMINARMETAADKPSFRNPFQKKRCIIPADGFFEWKRSSNEKIPYYIHRKDNKLFGFAGLFDIWKDPSGQEIKTFTILTTSPNKLMEPIHDRIPVILSKSNENLWLDQNETNIITLMSYLVKFPENEFEAYPVSPLVNSPKNNYKSIISKFEKSGRR